ncbi:hypothetical protein Acel_0171 [Acidothermus cellulolyticus 11B]|uniref:Transmembrane protein n=1 Tax=Acidothermus cellulolyticus (strain ATCC 43068 / DSM 8971 / 11B) TaxID=351607 RepID=A0LR86_ACIC1|nr:hypothetical protein [Acidothermus cellulolyticus]ABK51946.1 hypothetical protein Acel_0171 [Acidothermus cellulolyticus 11B]
MTGIIMGGIVALWIVVLVPMWLRRHEAEDASRSMEGFSTAMRVLAESPRSALPRRYRAESRRREILMPRRENWGPTVDNHPDVVVRRSRAVTARERRRLALRRRRRLTGLFGLFLAVTATCIVGWTSWWLELAVVLALVGYVVHLRTEVIRRREIQRHRRRSSRVSTPAVARDESPTDADTQVLPGVPADVLPPLTSPVGTANGSRWEPVPVPLPTYVSKPPANRPVVSAPRADVESATIDLTRPGEWSAQHATGRRHLLLDETGDDAAIASPAAEDDLDRIMRRVVGE